MTKLSDPRRAGQPTLNTLKDSSSFVCVCVCVKKQCDSKLVALSSLFLPAHVFTV